MARSTNPPLLGVSGAGKSATVVGVHSWSRDGVLEDIPVGPRAVLSPPLAPSYKATRADIGIEESIEQLARRIIELCRERFQMRGGGETRSDDPAGGGVR